MSSEPAKHDRASDPNGGAPPPGRPLRDRIVLRFPFLVDLTAAAMIRLPAGSPLRRRLVKRVFGIAWDGVNRGDFGPALLIYESDTEVTLIGGAGVGLAERYTGNDGWTEFIADIFENFGDPHFSVRRVLDGGDRLVAELALTATGRVSGAQVLETTTSIYHLTPRGKVGRQQVFWQQGSWDKALAAAGLSE